MSRARDLAWYLDPAQLFTAALGHEPDEWQAGVLRSTAPRLAINASRQSGKSSTVAVVGLWTALYRPGALVLVLSPSQRQSSEMLRKIRDSYLAVGQPVPAVNISATTLELSNRSRVVYLPAEETTVRGFSAPAAIILDEASRIEDAMWYAVEPMLAAAPSARVLTLSTPWGKRGWWWQIWTADDTWQRVEVNAYQVKHLNREFLDHKKDSLPRQIWLSEYMCQFTEAVDDYFAHADIEAALSHDVAPLIVGGALC